jgi:excisionase family DNA binding protein
MSALKQRTYQSDNRDELAPVHDFLRAHETAGRDDPHPKYVIAGADLHEHVEIPEEVYQVLVQVVEAMRHGHAVTVSPTGQTLTTQQAADLIGISRPTLIKLLDSGAIEYDRGASSHRRVKLHDVLGYLERRRAEQYAALAATSVSIDDADDEAAVLEALGRARARVAARRRERRGSK